MCHHRVKILALGCSLFSDCVYLQRTSMPSYIITFLLELQLRCLFVCCICLFVSFWKTGRRGHSLAILHTQPRQAYTMMSVISPPSSLYRYPLRCLAVYRQNHTKLVFMCSLERSNSAHIYVICCAKAFMKLSFIFFFEGKKNYTLC